jgi:hypothetical protein
VYEKSKRVPVEQRRTTFLMLDFLALAPQSVCNAFKRENRERERELVAFRRLACVKWALMRTNAHLQIETAITVKSTTRN